MPGPAGFHGAAVVDRYSRAILDDARCAVADAQHYIMPAHIRGNSGQHRYSCEAGGRTQGSSAADQVVISD